MLKRTTLVRADDGRTAHTSTWAVYRMALMKIGGVRLAAIACTELQIHGYFEFGAVKIELVKREKSSPI